MTSFSLEQLDMVRRLKQSGLSKEDILAAFDSFDTTDKELGSTYQLPVSIALQLQTLQAMVLNAASNNNNCTTNNTFANNLLTTNNNIKAVTNNNNLINNIKLSQDMVVTPTLHKTTTSNNNNISQEINPKQEYSDHNNLNNNNKNQTNNNSQNHISHQIEISNNINNNNDLEVDNKEFSDFISQGEVVCCEEIRQFATKHNIKQQQIATLAGICQSYVSRYMKGDIYDMSERSRRSIQKWYLVYRHNPASIAYAVNAAQHLCNMTSSKRPSSLEQLDFTADSAFPRRERFVFRAGHLEILERYFQDNNYPLYETREKIAHSCNIVTQNTAGRELTEREKVTTQIISNWFANKRKELKKLAKEEGLIDVNAVPVRPRGHPSRVYSDLIQHARHPEPSNNNTINNSISLGNTISNNNNNTIGNKNNIISNSLNNNISDTTPNAILLNNFSQLNGDACNN